MRMLVLPWCMLNDSLYIVWVAQELKTEAAKAQAARERYVDPRHFNLLPDMDGHWQAMRDSWR